MMMRKAAAWTLTLLLLLTGGSALAAPAELAEPLAGTVYYPEGAAAEDAVYRLTYAYPQFAGQGDAEGMMNEYYQYLLSDMLLFTAPLMGDMALDDSAQYYTDLNYEITRNQGDYLCVLFRQEQFLGASASENWTAHVFAREGAMAGEVVTLPYVLGTLAAEETDEKAIERATRKANAFVCGLVWDMIAAQRAEGTAEYYEDLTLEDLSAEFYPESDFYMDEENRLVFFIQPAMVASSAAGVLTYSFTLEDLRSEL